MPAAPSVAATGDERRAAPSGAPPRKRWYQQLYVWVLTAIAAGILVGYLWPSFATGLEPLGSMFVSLIKMVIAPVIFLTVVSGIAGVDDLRKVGRVGVKALVYFEVVSTVALVLGLVAVNIFRPGDGVHADPEDIAVSDQAASYIEQGEHSSAWHYLTDFVPSSFVGAFAEGDVLQVLVIAVLFGFAIKAVGAKAAPIAAGVERLSAVIFKMLHFIMYLAPIGAFGAMAYTIGEYGIETLTSLGQLIALFYGTSLFFVVVVLGSIAAANRVNIFRLLGYLKDELLIVLGTSSSESVLPQLMRKLENLGAPKPVVGLVVPTGYSFNLDGTSIYLTLGAMFVAQATDSDLSLGQQLALLAVLLLTSKGAAGVTGSGFIVLAATLSTVGTVPVAGIMLIFGIDKFMSECRALTNVTGNSLASIVVANWEGVMDHDRARKVLSGQPVPPLEDAAAATAPAAGDRADDDRADDDPAADAEDGARPDLEKVPAAGAAR
ncbi:C4-dicarboxylate transporter DctA [Allostreptomyces psammosilenae]|uniref:Aerobic C4-dicarboxylate transport protein n=1 Tax=Allostreptomyces psammosilenae TaxID=1892865 RepID=A0A853A1F2_9ACTN|nr:C4-dicarboxylate transporter DctA [Allostreptomyces psammosilenae]NYI08235.1 aerobic C4-dicarboxylate transport protein [Allostreptomyces psammosilenae]